jgi:hypothetical protein
VIQLFPLHVAERVNIKPVFVEELEVIVVTLGDLQLYTLPDIFDLEEEKVLITVELLTSQSFTLYDEDS